MIEIVYEKEVERTRFRVLLGEREGSARSNSHCPSEKSPDL